MFDTYRNGTMDTKQRILDAAEQLFAEHGFDGASLRAITGIAGVNLAAVNYHFKSKESLIQAVLARKLGPINQRRLALLDAYEADAGSKPVPLEKIVHAMIGPMVRPVPAAGGMSFGTVSQTLAAPGLLGLISGGASDPSDVEQTLSRVKADIVAGLRAPLPACGTPKGHRKGRTASHGPALRRHHTNAGGSPASLW